MFLLVSSRRVGAHPGGNQHGVSIQISINLGKKFVRISCIRKIIVTWILARVFAYLPSFFSQILDLIYWTVLILILNGTTLKTSNCFSQLFGKFCSKVCCTFTCTALSLSDSAGQCSEGNYRDSTSISFPEIYTCRFLFFYFMQWKLMCRLLNTNKNCKCRQIKIIILIQTRTSCNLTEFNIWHTRV